MGKDMTFWEHLDELRKVLFRSAVVLMVLTVVAFFCKEFIFDCVKAEAGGAF